MAIRNLTPDGDKIMHLRVDRGFRSRKRFAQHIASLCDLWGGRTKADLGEGEKALLTFVRQLQAEGRPEPEAPSPFTIRDVEQGGNCQPATLLAIAYGLGLPSYDSLLKKAKPQIPEERQLAGRWKGHFREMEFPKSKARFRANLRLKQNRDESLSADLEIFWQQKRIAFLTTDIALFFGQILKFDYTSVDKRDMRFGTVILELNGAGNRLTGYALGYSAFIEKVTVAEGEFVRK